jgi:RNA polymerase sigma-70 factor (ECF subfamily)
LRLAIKSPQENSAQLAAQLSERLGRSVRPEAFRQQLSRARRRFARLVLEEVRRTLEEPSPERLIEELTEVGLMAYVRPYLPRD